MDPAKRYPMAKKLIILLIIVNYQNQNTYHLNHH